MAGYNLPYTSTRFSSPFPSPHHPLHMPHSYPSPAQQEHYHSLFPHPRTQMPPSETRGWRRGWHFGDPHIQGRPCGPCAFPPGPEIATEHDCLSGMENVPFHRGADAMDIEYDGAEMRFQERGFANEDGRDWRKGYAASVPPWTRVNGFRPFYLGEEQGFEDAVADGTGAPRYWKEAWARPETKGACNARNRDHYYPGSCPQAPRSHHDHDHHSFAFLRTPIQAQQYPGNPHHSGNHQNRQPHVPISLPHRPVVHPVQCHQPGDEPFRNPFAKFAGGRYSASISNEEAEMLSELPPLDQRIEELADEEEESAETKGLDTTEGVANERNEHGRQNSSSKHPLSSSPSVSSPKQDPDLEPINEPELFPRADLPTTTFPPHPYHLPRGFNPDFDHHERHRPHNAYSNLEAKALLLRRERRKLRAAWRELRHAWVQYPFMANSRGGSADVKKEKEENDGLWSEEEDSDDYDNRMEGEGLYRQREGNRSPYISYSSIPTTLMRSRSSSPLSSGSLSPRSSFAY